MVVPRVRVVDCGYPITTAPCLTPAAPLDAVSCCIYSLCSPARASVLGSQSSRLADQGGRLEIRNRVYADTRLVLQSTSAAWIITVSQNAKVRTEGEQCQMHNRLHS